MDLVCYFIFALVCMGRTMQSKKSEVEIVDRETKQNPNFYRDEDAFMEYPHEILGV